MDVSHIRESDRIEFKECKGKKVAKLPNDLWQSICAFSNSHGGEIHLGVDNDGKVVGLSDTDIDSIQKDLSTLISNAFNVKPRIEICVENDHVCATVMETEFYNKPIYRKKIGPKQIWIRQGATNVRATDEEIRSLFAGASGGGENQVVEGNAYDLIDADKVSDYVRRTGLRNLDIGSTEKALAKIKALRDGKVTIFGLIAFGKDSAIDDVLNNCYIDFRVFSGVSKVDDGSLNRIYTERMEFHGDMKSQFLGAFEYIKTKLPTEGILNSQTGLREDRYKLPEEALREALANAIAHRDYLIHSSCVNIDLYADRIELFNPGESLVAIRDLERSSSKARNPNLMEFLKTYNITDKTARGIPTIYKAARTRGLLDPKFENISGCFKATLYFSSPHTGEDKEWVDKIDVEHKLRDTQRNALVYIKNFGSISNKQYCEINHMNQRNDDRRARRELGELVERKLIKMVGVGPGTKYILTGN